MEATRHVYHHYAVLALRRDDLAAALRENGIGTGIHYPVPCHQQPAITVAADNGDSVPSLPNAERIAVPFTVVGERHFVGYLDDASSGAQIVYALEACRRDACTDVVGTMIAGRPDDSGTRRSGAPPDAPAAARAGGPVARGESPAEQAAGTDPKARCRRARSDGSSCRRARRRGC